MQNSSISSGEASSLNQRAFINELRLSLANLAASDREEILSQQENLFHESLLKGISEAEYVSSLSPVKRLGPLLIAELKLNQFLRAPHLAKKASLSFGAVFSFTNASPSAFFTVLLPYVILTLINGGAWIFSITVILIGVFLIGVFIFKALLINVGFWTQLSALLFALGWLSLGILFFVMTYLCTEILFSRMSQYLGSRLNARPILKKP